MKRLVSIFALSLYLLSATEVHQFLKLPMLLVHFVQHQEENQSLSFLEFLDMHYMQGSPQDADYDEDMKLPFKSHEDCAGLNIPVIPLDGSQFTEPLSPVISQIFKDYSPSFNYSSFQASVWQPPKSC